MASAATTKGAVCPRRVSMDKTRLGKFKMFLWAQQDTNTALLAVTCGLDPRGLSQWRPAGLSQRRAGDVISRERRAWVSRGQRRDLSRTAASSPANGGLGEPQTAASSPANGGLGHPPRTAGSGERLAWDSLGRRRISPVIGRLEGAADSGGLLPRSAGWRARGQRTRRTPMPT